MSISIVQSAKYQPGSTGTSVVLTLGSAPTPGNILVAFTSYSLYLINRVLTAPDGTWTKIDDVTDGNSLSAWWHPVVSGDGTSYTFPISGSAEWQSGVIYEISGAYLSSPIDQSTIGPGNQSLTPSVLNTLPLAAITYSGATLSSYGAGWTLDQSAIPSYHLTYAVHKTTLTADITTPVTTALSPAGPSILVLISPTAPSPPATVYDPFTGTDNDPPSSTLWDVISGTPVINTNRLRIHSYPSDLIKSKFYFTDNFDIQIDFDVIGASATNSWLLQFYVYIDATHNLSWGTTTYNGVLEYQSGYINGGSAVYAQNSDTPTTGKLRIVRNGASFAYYFWNGSSWAVGAASPQTIGSIGNSVYVQLAAVAWNGNPNVTTYFDNFAVNHGTALGLSTTRDLTTACAVASTVSAPIAAITRPLASSPAAVSAVAAPILAITRALQATVAVGSATSTPSLLILRALISAISGVSDVGTPSLAVVRPLSSSLDAISAVSTPNLAVQRALAMLAAVMSETPDIELLLHGILDLATAIAAQSQVSGPALNVARPLDSSIAAQAQTSAAILAVLRALASTIVLEAQTPNIALKVLRDLLTVISAQSVASPLILEIICSLITEAHVVTNTSAGALAVLRDLVATIAVQSALSEFDLAMGVPRDLVTLVAALTQTSGIDVTLAFHESLLAKAKRYFGPVSAVDLKAAALSWAVTEEDKEANLPGDQYNDHEF